MARMCAQAVAIDDGGQLGAWPHQAHLTAQHVHELWQFVEAAAAEEPAEAGVARVVGRLVRDASIGPVEVELRHPAARPHRAELHHLEVLPAATDAQLPEQHASTQAEAHGRGSGGQNGPQDDQRRARDRHVDPPFDAPLVERRGRTHELEMPPTCPRSVVLKLLHPPVALPLSVTVPQLFLRAGEMFAVVP